MATGLPGKIIADISRDVKAKMKAKKSPWSGFGPIAEGHSVPGGAIVVWRQGASIEGTRYNYMVGAYRQGVDGWDLVGEVSNATTYDAGSKIGVEARVKEAKAILTGELVAA